MQGEQLLHFGPYRFDRQTMQLWRGTQVVKLPPKALALLATLITRAGEVVTKDELFHAVWPETVVSDDALTSCMQELRQALRDDARQPRYIETVHRRGYRFIAPLSIPQPVVSSQNSVVSSREEVVSSDDNKHRAQSTEHGVKISLPSLVPNTQHQVSSLDEARQTPGEEHGQTEGLRLKVEGSPPVSRPTHRWSRKVFLLSVALLLIGTGLTIHYLSRSSLRTLNPELRTEAAPAALPLPDKPSIAVIPFTNMSGDPAQEYFSTALTKSLGLYPLPR